VEQRAAPHGRLPRRSELERPAEAYGSPLFFADREEYPVIVDLFKLRDRLVHPKPGFGVAGTTGEPDANFARLFAMGKVAEYVVMVGGSAELLMRRAYGFDSVEVIGTVIWRGRPVIRDYAKRHARLPAWNAPSERPLFRQAGDHVMAMPRVPDIPGDWWTRLREARQGRAAK
jgi:hypothetical protein